MTIFDNLDYWNSSNGTNCLVSRWSLVQRVDSQVIRPLARRVHLFLGEKTRQFFYAWLISFQFIRIYDYKYWLRDKRIYCIHVSAEYEETGFFNVSFLHVYFKTVFRSTKSCIHSTTGAIMLGQSKLFRYH